MSSNDVSFRLAFGKVAQTAVEWFLYVTVAIPMIIGLFLMFALMLGIFVLVVAGFVALPLHWAGVI